MNACKKGKAGEREAAHYINGLFPGLDMRRGAQHAGNADAPDIKGFPGVHWEVKRAEKLNIHAAMAQAVRDAEGKSVPVVLHRRNRGKWLVTLEGDNLCAFARAVVAAESAGMPIATHAERARIALNGKSVSDYGSTLSGLESNNVGEKQEDGE